MIRKDKALIIRIAKVTALMASRVETCIHPHKHKNLFKPRPERGPSISKRRFMEIHGDSDCDSWRTDSVLKKTGCFEKGSCKYALGTYSWPYS